MSVSEFVENPVCRTTRSICRNKKKTMLAMECIESGKEREKQIKTVYSKSKSWVSGIRVLGKINLTNIEIIQNATGLWKRKAYRSYVCKAQCFSYPSLIKKSKETLTHFS